MSVFVDNARIPATVGRVTARWSHLSADSRDELHTFAASIGLRREWFQDKPDPATGKPGRHWHYDVTDTKRAQAIAAGARQIDVREWGAILAARAGHEARGGQDAEPVGYGQAAPLYRAAGWVGVLPLPARAKKRPPKIWISRDEAISFHGHDGVDPTDEQVATWRRRYPHGNLALRLPATVLGIDLDLYKAEGVDSYARLVAECGPLPATWMSTNRADGSGIRLFTVPAGVCWSERRAGPGIELIRVAHRYMVVWPSIHPQGRRYRWYEPSGAASGRLPVIDELTRLPAVWGRRLSQPPTPRPVRPSTNWRGTGGQGLAAASLAGAVGELAGLAVGQHRNEALNRKAYHLGGYVAAGQLDQADVREQLYAACQTSGYVERHGTRATLATIDSGLRAGMNRPRRSA